MRSGHCGIRLTCSTHRTVKCNVENTENTDVSIQLYQVPMIKLYRPRNMKNSSSKQIILPSLGPILPLYTLDLIRVHPWPSKTFTIIILMMMNLRINTHFLDRFITSTYSCQENLPNFIDFEIGSLLQPLSTCCRSKDVLEPGWIGTARIEFSPKTMQEYNIAFIFSIAAAHSYIH